MNTKREKKKKETHRHEKCNLYLFSARMTGEREVRVKARVVRDISTRARQRKAKPDEGVRAAMIHAATTQNESKPA